jgi:tetratricopeptide (TPR) repeat protein
MLTIQYSDPAPDVTNFTQETDIVANLKELARVYRAHEQFNDAKLLCRKALLLERLFLGPTDMRVAATMAELASLNQEEGELGQAAVLYKQALSIAERKTPNGLITANILEGLSRCYWQQALYSEARTLSKRAASLKKSATL